MVRGRDGAVHIGGVDAAGTLRLVRGRPAGEESAVLLHAPRDECALAESLDVGGEKERVAEVGGFAGGMSADVGAERFDHGVLHRGNPGGDGDVRFKTGRGGGQARCAAQGGVWEAAASRAMSLASAPIVNSAEAALGRSARKRRLRVTRPPS